MRVSKNPKKLRGRWSVTGACSRVVCAPRPWSAGQSVSEQNKDDCMILPLQEVWASSMWDPLAHDAVIRLQSQALLLVAFQILRGHFGTYCPQSQR